MLVVVCNSTLCKNPVVFFEKFEWINLFCFLVQFGFFYSNPNLICSSTLEFSPAYSPPCKTLKSRRRDPLEDFWIMKPCLFLSVQNWCFAKLAQKVSDFVKLTSPPSLSTKETLIWRIWPPQELPRCLWHFVKHPVCTTRFGMISSLHCELDPLTRPACHMDLPKPIAPPC